MPVRGFTAAARLVADLDSSHHRVPARIGEQRLVEDHQFAGRGRVVSVRGLAAVVRGVHEAVVDGQAVDLRHHSSAKTDRANDPLLNEVGRSDMASQLSSTSRLA